ncbi:MAG: hypothetical protein ACFFDY_02560 [Candidatus Thorarchaeota archaeon]
MKYIEKPHKEVRKIKIKKICFVNIIIIIVFLTPIGSVIYTNNKIAFKEQDHTSEFDENYLKTSDIAGSDLYAEKIDAFVAGNKSIIKQSLFTNDTNILSQFDSNDPAFYKCNVIMSATNGINPDIFPAILTESQIPSQYVVGFNNFVGFLYYDKDLDNEDASLRAERALEIIRRKFMIDLIMVNVSEPNFFPFIGFCPNWNCFFNELTNNFPLDGYWKALDIDRLTSKEYLENYHISSTFLLLNSLDFFDGDFDISTDQVNFNIDSIDLSFLQTLEIENLIDQLNSTLENFGDLYNTTASEDGLEQFIDIFSAFTLNNNSHYTSISIQYEGLSNAIQKVGINEYKFNLWDAMGYEGPDLAPSEKIFIELTGALLSEININILCTDIIDVTPQYFDFYDYLLEQLALLFYYAGVEIDIKSLEDYSFELYWIDDGGIKQSFVKPINRQDPSDIINLLQQFGIQLFSYIPTGIINPIEDLIITYNISNSDYNLLLKKDLIGGNASYGAFRNFSYYISTENVGTKTVWGVPTPIDINLDYFFQIISPFSWESLKNEMWEVIKIEYPNQYESLEDFFNFDEDPRIFYFDSFGTGIYDYYYPELFNITNLWPYNEDVDDIIDIVYSESPFYFTLPPNTVKEFLMNENSIWNDNNWRLDPGGVISYQIDNYSISNLDSFSPFYRNNFSIDTTPETPELISGTSLSGSIPEMALTDDNYSWIINSEEEFLDQKIEIDFIFRNETNIDLTNNTLESVSLIIDFNVSDDIESINFEIFNFDDEEFQSLDPYLVSTINNTWTFSIVNMNKSIDWLFYPLDKEDYTSLFKIECLDSEAFNISINDLDIEFSTRDINFNQDPGSRIVYGSSTGNVQFERRSNSIPLSTYDAASIIAISNLANYTSKPGELNKYTLSFKNIGSTIAQNVSISILIPGIIEDLSNFTLQNSNLTYYLSMLAPFEEKTINFTFFVPNSISISKISISYNNPKNIEGGNSSKIVSYTNEVYCSAPVDYDYLFPFVRIIKINLSSNEITPIIGEIFNLTVNIKNIGPKGFNIPDLNISMNDQFGDLKRVENNTIQLENITYNGFKSITLSLKKYGWKGYYYPPINNFESSESRTLQICSSSSIILGVVNFSIVKNVNREQIEVGETIVVYIEVENTGTISTGNVVINDMISYSQSDFSLIDGKLIHFINSLDPGEIIILNYTLRAERQSLVTLKPAVIKYYYFHEIEFISNNVLIKIITPKLRQFSYVALPMLIVFGITIIYMWQIRKYKKRKIEFQRSEMVIFKLSSRDTVLKIEHTLRERLHNLQEKLKQKNIDYDEFVDNSLNSDELG